MERRLTKIQATLGPASSEVQTIRRMAEAGMDGCRLNMSHGSHASIAALVTAVRRVSMEMGRPLALGADLRGPKLRIGDVAGGQIVLEEGATLALRPGDHLTDSHQAFVDYPHLVDDLRPGDPVLLNDGALVLRVEEIARERALCRVVKGGQLTSRKGINLPGVPLKVPSLTPKDLLDLAFAVAVHVDFLYVSYARSREHIEAVRAALARLGADMPVVAKIERQEGVDRLPEILQAADGICVARGDLGIETPLGAVPAIQSEAARLCREAGKFAMIGGQILASMVSSPMPLRAEVSDLATAVRDGLDALVLSDETAAGSYPVEAVQVAAQVLARVEADLTPPVPLPDAGKGAGGLGLAATVLVSRNGREAAALSASRRCAPIVAATDRPGVANWLATWWGVFPVLLDDLSDPELAHRRALEAATAAGIRPSPESAAR